MGSQPEGVTNAFRGHCPWNTACVVSVVVRRPQHARTHGARRDKCFAICLDPKPYIQTVFVFEWFHLSAYQREGMSKQLANIHDALFKRALGQPELAGRFLREHLPPELADELAGSGCS